MNKWNLGKVRGEDGKAATIAIGTVRTGPAGSNASVKNVGDSLRAIFDFTIPRGEKGDKSDTGPQGLKGEKGDKGDTGPQGLKGEKGDKGDTGPQGLKGEKGDKGDTGPQGPAGSDAGVNAGAGIDITGDTISVKFGTTAGTAAQGNDSRIVNSVRTSENQTIAGIKTFTSFPVTPSDAPTSDYQTANKKYVDDKVASGGGSTNAVLLTGNQTIADTKTFTSFPVTPSSAPTSDYQTANKKYVDDKVASGGGGGGTTVNGIGFGQNIINFAVSGDGNISYSDTLKNNTLGSANTAAGTYALQKNTTGSSNTASGFAALQNNTAGIYNTATGIYALLENTTGSRNTAIGVSALEKNTTEGFNTAIGIYALRKNTTGNSNTAVGAYALLENTSYSNCSGLGYSSQVTASNQIQLGNSGTTVYAYGAVQNRSDARDKTEIRDTVLGLDFINALRPVDYKLDMRDDYRVELGENPTEEQRESNKLSNIKTDGTHTRKRYHHGVIAQEVAETMEVLGVDFGGYQDHSKNGGDDVLSIGYEEFIAPLIKAVQELSTRVKELEGKS